MSKLLASLMRNYFPKRPSGAPLHTLSKLYDVPVGFVTPSPYFEAVYCLFCCRQRVAVARYRMICLVLRSGPQRQRHFVGFSLQAPIRAILFTVISRNRPNFFVFYDTLGIRRTYSHLKPSGSPTGRVFHFPCYKLSFPEYQYSFFVRLWRFYFPSSYGTPELIPLKCMIVLL